MRSTITCHSRPGHAQSPQPAAEVARIAARAPRLQAMSGLVRRDRRGFTIMEVAMATFVMAFGIASSIIAMQTGFKQIDLARGTTIAAQIIQSEMERLRMMSWTDINRLHRDNPNPTSDTFDGANFFSDNPDLVGKYTIIRTISNNAATSEIKDLKVSVRWQTYDGRAHERNFTALYAMNGLYDYYYTIAHP